MSRYSIAAAALVVAASATVASASTLTKVGGLFAAQGSVVSNCVLDDGSHLRLARDDVEGGVEQMWLEHRDAAGELATPPLLLTVGSLAWWKLDCGHAGEAVVSWISNGNNDPLLHYRLVPGDHRSASEVRTPSTNGDGRIYPSFAVWAGGYTMAWIDYHEGAHTDMWVQGFEPDGTARYAPTIVSADPTNWHSTPGLGSDREGNTLVSWEEGGAGHREIVAVAISADGQTSGAPLLVLSGGSDLLGNGPEFVVARDVGSFAAAWYSWAAEGLVGQRLRIEEVAPQATTTTSSTSTTMEDDPTPDFSQERGWGREESLDGIGPMLASDGRGGWLAMWRGAIGPRMWREHFRLTSVSSDSGRRWSQPVRVDDDALDIVSDGAGEWFAVGEGRVLREYGEDSYHWVAQIQLLQTTGGGSEWPTTRGIADVPYISDEDCYSYVTAMTLGRNRSGALAVAWAQTTECDDWWYGDAKHDVYVIRSVDDAASWTLPQRIATEPDAGLGRLQLESVGTNGWLLILGDVGSWLTRSDDDGLSWSEPRRTGQAHESLGWAGDADVTCDSSDQCVAVFSYEGSSANPFGWGHDGDVAASSSSDGGLTWSETVPINVDAFVDVASDRNPVVASDGNGLWTAAWISHRDFGGRIGLDADLLEASSTDGGMTWSPPRPLSDAAAHDGWLQDVEPRIAHDAGAWVAMWNRRTDTEDYDSTRSEARFAVADESCGDGALDDFDECDDGNRIDGDGCDSNCYATGCNNGVVSVGEECDDGNTRDDDACPSVCTVARCGDGYVRAGVEACDDGNAEDDDACTNACTPARCGDGVVARGLEECDDANTTNEDACPSTCRAATCGDGFVQDGVEQCDDANQNTQDRCPAGCRNARCGDGYLWLGVEPCDPAAPGTGAECPATCGVNACGDANGDGEHTVTDAVTILSSAVGVPAVCPMSSCDVDGNLKVGANDALISLGLSVGLPYALHCDPGPWLIVRLQDARSFGALQVRADVSGAPLSVITRGNAAACEPLVPGLLVASGVSGSYLTVGMIAYTPFSGPADLARCRVEVHGDIHPSQFAVTIEDATDYNGNQQEPRPAVVLRGAVE